jgi:GNAT superfamily N-acetyltransferase
MTADLFAHYAARTREAFAKGYGCPTDAFDSHALTIVDRPDKPWATLMAVTFGTGTVLQLDPAYREFAEANPPDKHYHAMSLGFLNGLVEEGARRGQKLRAYAPSLCFTIAAEPPDLPVPSGFELREHDAAWMAAEQANRRFTNGVGVPGEEGRDYRNRFALVLRDAAGEPAAVAGAFDTFGMLEIGVDVAREHRGEGLGRLVVSALAREIMRRGDVPFYGCGPTNIRSHRTAESCGFRAICADAVVSGPL